MVRRNNGGGREKKRNARRLKGKDGKRTLAGLDHPCVREKGSHNRNKPDTMNGPSLDAYQDAVSYDMPLYFEYSTEAHPAGRLASLPRH